jgi:sulfur carrier protein ThiS
MRVQAKLFGTLVQKLPGYEPSQGIEVELPEGATVRDLLTRLELSSVRGAVVVAQGRVLKVDDRLQRGVPVSIMQTVSGG